MNRDDQIKEIQSRQTPWDIIVIGGGSTGVGCAVDAASRGLSVLLLEQHDFGKGSSSRSTKLIHGGVRYLEQGNFSLVREALRERAILFRNAPHVVQIQSFIVPCYSFWQKYYYGLGLKVYDLLAGEYGIGKSRILSKSETIEQLPNSQTKGLVGGVLYHDGQFDDTRLLIDLVTTAAKNGATVLNYAKVKSLKKDENGHVIGVEFDDLESGESYKVLSKCVINATGAFCDEIRLMSEVTSKPIVTLSQGVHLVFDQSFLQSDYAVMIPKTSDGRVLFVIPWLGHTLVGTTDTPIEYATLEPKPLESEIEFILETATNYLSKKPTREDILSVFVGIRPLVNSKTARTTASLSRGHTIEIDSSQLLTITGGKWTTYRHMAEDAIDQASKLAELNAKPSNTRNLKIEQAKLDYQSRRDRLHPDLPYTREDVIQAVRFEIARTLEDVLARRSRALFLNAKAAIEMAPAVAQIMSDELEKDENWRVRQIDEFNSMAKAYLPF